MNTENYGVEFTQRSWLCVYLVADETIDFLDMKFVFMSSHIAKSQSAIFSQIRDAIFYIGKNNCGERDRYNIFAIYDSL